MELIKITEQANGMQAVNARELYEFLGFDLKNWSRWYLKNIINNDFAIENVDFQTFVIERNGNNTKDFALSVDFAKRLSMMARTEKGEEARRYFIECEKNLKAQQSKTSNIDLTDPATVLKLAQNWKEEHDKRKEAEQQAQILLEQNTLQSEELKKQAPKVAYVDKVLQSKSVFCITIIAKELGTTATKLNKFLQEKGVQYRLGASWVLYSKYDNKGYTQTKTAIFQTGQGIQKTSIQTVWTEYGRAFIHHLFKQ